MADNSDSNTSPDSYQQLGAADEVRRAKNWLSSPVSCISDLEEFIAKFEEHFDLQTSFHRQYNSSAGDTDFDVIECAFAEAKAGTTSDKMLDLSFHIGHLFSTMELCQANGPDAFPFDAAAIQEVRTALLMVPLSKDKSEDRGEAICKLKSAIFRFRSFALDQMGGQERDLATTPPGPISATESGASEEIIVAMDGRRCLRNEFTEDDRLASEWAAICGFSDDTFRNRMKAKKGTGPTWRIFKVSSQRYIVHVDDLPSQVRGSIQIREERLPKAKEVVKEKKARPKDS